MIILENMKVEQNINNNVKIIEVGFERNRIIDFYINKIGNKM